MSTAESAGGTREPTGPHLREQKVMAETSDLRRKVLGLFGEWGRETLDLHELFEAGDSNDPDLRREVFFTVEGLVEEGLLEERGNDFYALTARGRKSLEGGGRGGL